MTLLMKDTPFTPALRKVMQVTATNLNRRVPLKDRMGLTSMVLNAEEQAFIQEINGDAGVSLLLSNKYLVKNPTNGIMRLFPFLFDGQIVGIISEKGVSSQILSIGKDPFSTEAYILKKDNCNPVLFPHLFSSSIFAGQVVHIPLLQPKPLNDGSPNYWGVPMENLVLP